MDFSSHLARGVFYGAAFALVETLFRCLTDEDADGTVRFRPNLAGRTTWAMVPGSMLGGLYVLEPFHGLVQDRLLRLFLWPLPIWLIEVLWGAFLFYGCNGTRAWHYRGAGARLNGFVKLTYYPLWLGLGAILDAFYDVAGVW